MKELINPNVLELTPYKAGLPIECIREKYNVDKVIKLASNENPLPIPAHVSEAIVKEISRVNSYPVCDSYFLKNELARYNGVDAGNVIVGAGSVELIRMIIKSFLQPGETVLTSEKTFVLYKIATIETAGKKAFVEAPMGEDFRFDLDRMYRLVDDNTKIIFLTNPNNPTGTMLPKQDIIDFIDKIPEDKLVVLDNAYQEYIAGREEYLDGIDMALNRKNVIVLRTFSKIYGLAGLRIGYAVSNEDIISFLSRVKAPFNVTRIAQAAALASLRDDGFKTKSAELNIKNREKLYRQLTEMGMKTVPSVTNFFLFFPGTAVDELNVRLLKEGVIIRPLQAFGFPDAMRVTVGLEEDNDFFIQKLKKVLNEAR
jgi:histidinol-phosphate aminotransferase